LEGTFRGHLVQPTGSEQGHLQVDQGAQSDIQPGLEWFQGWGLHHLSGQPGPLTLVSSANLLRVHSVLLSKSLMKMLNSTSTSTDP